MVSADPRHPSPPSDHHVGQPQKSTRCVSPVLTFAVGFLVVAAAGAFLYWNSELRVPAGTPLPDLRIRDDAIGLDSSGEAFSFAVLGDNCMCEAPRLAVMEDAQAREILFLCNMGDVVRFANPAHWKRYMRELQSHLKPNLPYFHTPGNHDVDHQVFGKQYKFYEHYLGRTWYAVDAGEWRLVFLDTGKLGLSQIQRNWLGEKLGEAKQQGKRVILLTHTPPRSTDGGPVDHTMGSESSRALAEIISGYDVAAIFAGHIHKVFTYEWHGIPVYVSSLSKQTWKPDPAEYYQVWVEGKELEVKTIQVMRPAMND
ncbi:MAG TPA: metallophosphoesterase [Sumerlaeia bacterium]|nr:metallophosphoesterase [Sumerlaeia bacterium]